MTHRDRARNAASSRAIPWPKMMKKINEDPVVPIRWGMEKKGMQAGEELPIELQHYAEALWLELRDRAVEYADKIHNIGDSYDDAGLIGGPGFRGTKIHKSLPNRLTEPWMWITVVMTARDWKNLFRLRVHPDAEIHFQKIAGMLKTVLDESVPVVRQHGDWHLPYVNAEERCIRTDRFLCKVSTARCARISYLTQNGKRDPNKDIELFDRLCQGSGFGHWSPHEHVATPATPDVRSGCMRGWLQYRKFFKTECAPE